MIDVHTHMTYVLDNRVGQAARAAATVFLAQENARKTLETGVTTVRDLGAGGLRRHRDARPDCAGPDAGAADVRGGIRAADYARAARLRRIRPTA